MDAKTSLEICRKSCPYFAIPTNGGVATVIWDRPKQGLADKVGRGFGGISRAKVIDRATFGPKAVANAVKNNGGVDGELVEQGV
jgi:hypothetical protein